MKYTILIADRNTHVRRFLKREMMEEGYQVLLAENGREVLKWIYQHEPLDLLILDTDLPDVDESLLLKGLQDRIPPLPVVVHIYKSDYDSKSSLLNAAIFVEKKGSSVENLKQVVSNMLSKSGSQEVETAKKDESNSSEIKYE